MQNYYRDYVFMKKAAGAATQGGFLELAEIVSADQQIHHVKGDEHLDQEEGSAQHHQNK